MKKRVAIILSILSVLMVVGAFIFRNLSFTSKTLTSSYQHADKYLNFTVPGLFFDKKETKNHLALKYFRSDRVLRQELEETLKTYQVETCNDKKYYYQPELNYTIIDYGIHSHLLFNTVYYEYRLGSYCDNQTLSKISQLIDYKVYFLYNKEKENLQYQVGLVTGTEEGNAYSGKLQISIYDPTTKEILYKENSTGVFDLATKGKLKYHIQKIEEQTDSSVIVPQEIIFTIEDKSTLKLENNYLTHYFPEGMTLESSLKK